MTAPKKDEAAEEPTPAPKAAAKPRTDPIVVFVPSAHSVGTTAPSGATFSFSPGVSTKIRQSDAETFVAEGLGSIQGA